MRNPLETLFQRFRRDQRGNVAMMYAVSLVVLIGGLGLGLDAANGYKAKSRLQNVTDAVTLLVAKGQLEDNAEIQAAAREYFAASYPGAKGADIEILDVQRDGAEVRIATANKTDTFWMGMFGRDAWDISVESSAIYSEQPVDIALVLDTTLSMEGSKIASLRNAATDMVDTLDGYGNDQLRVSVVPFSNYVNVGLSRRNAPWLEVQPDRTTRENVCRNKRDVISRSNCRTVQQTCDRDGTPVACSRRVCDVQYGPTRRVCGEETKTSRWNGCVGSRNGGFDERVEFAGRRVPGLMNARCGAELQTLTNRMADVNATIRSLTPSGNTYMPSGILWGWRTLDGRMPLSTTVNSEAMRVMVIMTDGQNSRSKNGNWHEARGNSAAADRKTRDLCNAIKSDDIVVFTIAYEVTDGATQSLLQRCATGPGNFFNARNADELNKAFQDIGASVNTLRITT